MAKRASLRAGAGFGGAFGYRALTLTAAALLPPMAWAQDSDENSALAPKAEFTIGQQIAVDNGDVMGVTPLDLNIQTGTRAQLLQFSMSLPVNEGDPDQPDFLSFGDRDARLFYRRGAKNSAIETEFTYRESDLDDTLVYDDVTNEFVSVDRGSVATKAARLGYVFGQQAKIGGELGLSYSQRDYTGLGTTSSALYDSETAQGDIKFYLEPTPLIRARILASENRVDSDGGTDSRYRDAGAGAAMQIDKVTNLDAELTHTRIHRDKNDGTTEETSGPTYRLALTRSRPLGDWRLSYDSAPGTSGRRDNMMLGRSLEMKTYELAASVGATHFEGNYDPIFDISYARELSRISRFQAALTHRAVTGSDGDESLNTSVSANYRRQLSEISGLNAGLQYRSTDVQTGDNSNGESVSFNINYNRELYSDLSLVAGASITRSSSDDDDDDDDERVYLGISRSFDWLP